MFRAAGAITDEELLTFRKFGSGKLEDIPTPVLPWVDVATGSLGEDLPIAVGIALCGPARSIETPARIVALAAGLPDGGGLDLGGGPSTPACEGLDKLVAIVDVNRLGQRGETMHGWNLDSCSARARGGRVAHDPDRRP